MPRRIQRAHREFRDVIEERVRKELGRLKKTGKIVGIRPNGDKFIIDAPRIDLPHIVCGNNGDEIGRGPFKKGDVLKKGNSSGEGGGDDGDGEGEHKDGIKVAVDIDDMFEWLGQELSLPPMLPKSLDTYSEIKYIYNDISKIGPRSLRHPRRTLLEALKRMAMTGELDQLHILPGSKTPMRLITPINSDQRYRQYREVRIPTSNAVIFFARDCSGSMGDFHCDMVNDIAWWISGWIRRYYKHTEVVHLLHDTEAMEVDEETFYSYREGGGTKCSTVFQLMSEMLENRYPPKKHNIYFFYFTDGDNENKDNPVLLDMMRSFKKGDVNMIGVTQINPHQSTTVYKYIKDNWGEPTDATDYLRAQELVCPESSLSERNKMVLRGIRFLLGKGEVNESE